MFNRHRSVSNADWIALAGFFIVALLYTLPLAAHWVSHIPGDNGDSVPHLWPFWYFPQALLNAGGENLFHPLLQFYPDGISLVYANSSPIGAILMAPISLLLSPAAALNTWITLHIWLGGWFFYRFSRNLGAGFWGGWLGGFAYCCSPFVAVHLPGHFTLVQIGYTSAALYFLSSIIRNSKNDAIESPAPVRWLAPAAGLGISCWAVAATDFYLAVMTLFLLATALIHFIVMHGRHALSSPFWKSFIGAAVLTALLLLPWTYLVLQAREGHDYSALNPAMGSNNVARWSRLVNPPAYHSVWLPRLYPAFIGKFPGISEYTYLGIIGFIVAVIGLLLRRELRRSIVWIIAFIVALGLAGANGYTPEPAWPASHPLSFGKWWPHWFPLSEFRVPARWQFVLCACLAAGISLGADGLVRKMRPTSRAVTCLLIFALMSFDLLRWPLPIIEARPLKTGIEHRPVADTAVLDIPVGVISGQGHSLGIYKKETLLRQMDHGRPVLSANVARLPNDVIDRRKADAELAVLLAVQSGERLSSQSLTLDWTSFIKRYNITTVRIPTDWPTSAGLTRLIEQSGHRWSWVTSGPDLIGNIDD